MHVSAGNLKAGDEVYITYRYEGNARLLLDYGFAECLSSDQVGGEGECEKA